MAPRRLDSLSESEISWDPKLMNTTVGEPAESMLMEVMKVVSRIFLL